MDTKERSLGRFSVDLEIANYQDVIEARVGSKQANSVRRAGLRGLVDTGATRLVLPESAVSGLGLESTGSVGVRYADGRRSTRIAVRDVEVAIQGRSGVFSAVVEPDRTEALIGAIVLEELDFVVDCVRQALVPRDPDTILVEIE
jgi:predicted aspartyl protease